tara:strand:- start:220 stop:423 length:204 start_codon:yes stop_codon:yes gene_type:complete
MINYNRKSEIVRDKKSINIKKKMSSPVKQMAVDFGVLVSQNQNERQLPCFNEKPFSLKGSYHSLAMD